MIFSSSGIIMFSAEPSKYHEAIASVLFLKMFHTIFSLENFVLTMINAAFQSLKIELDISREIFELSVIIIPFRLLEPL